MVRYGVQTKKVKDFYNQTPLLQKEYVRAAFECVDWDDTEEVTTLFYMAKDLVQGRRKDSISCRCEHIRDRKGEV